MPQFKEAPTGMRNFARRVMIYILGMFILAVGVSVSVKSRLGVSPVSSIPYVVSLIFHVDQGIATTVIFCLYVALQFLLLRKQFPLISLFQILCATVFGYFVTLCNSLLRHLKPEYYLVRLVLMCVSIVLIACGIMLYLTANLIPQPAEGLILAIIQKTGWGLSSTKIGFDCTVVGIAALLSFVMTGTLLGLREGTLIAMLGVGKVLGILNGLFGERIHRFCMGRPRSKEACKGGL